MEPTTVREAMRDEVVTARPDMPLIEAARLLYSHGINGLPVADDDGRVVGMVGIKDVLRAPFRSDDEVFISTITPLPRLAGHLRDLRVSDVMARHVSVVHPDEPLSKVMAFMVNRGIHPIPVVDAERRLLGVVGRADVLGVLLSDGLAPDAEPAVQEGAR